MYKHRTCRPQKDAHPPLSSWPLSMSPIVMARWSRLVPDRPAGLAAGWPPASRSPFLPSLASTGAALVLATWPEAGAGATAVVSIFSILPLSLMAVAGCCLVAAGGKVAGMAAAVAASTPSASCRAAGVEAAAADWDTVAEGAGATAAFVPGSPAFAESVVSWVGVGAADAGACAPAAGRTEGAWPAI
jgi:hypothetical protein